MENKIIVSGFSGSYFEHLSSITFPYMKRYADKYGMNSELRELPDFGRPASWSKIIIFNELLKQYDLVIWLDSDVLIVDNSEDISIQCQDNNIQYLANHNVVGNNNPNCGVWILKKEMIPYLKTIWNNEKYINNHWWEQAAVVECMGYEVTKNPDGTNKAVMKDESNELYKLTGKMNPKWNHSEFNIDKSQNPLFLHFAGTPNRTEKINEEIKNRKLI